ncbi:MAG TPA: PQQ-binding-like beta-propeller repeat protein [Lysobacter sp.]|nr:PQQ-binding-like beta-propeller repeat protein [Lysobacter sp.]
MSAQSLGSLFKQAVKQATKQAAKQATDKIEHQANARTTHMDEHARIESGVAGGTTPDDSPAAREAALARLRSAAPHPVCAARGTMGQVYGSTCNSREFPAPPLLAAPKLAWETRPGWWGAWSPFLVGNLMLTGSCNNDDNAGVSALDMRSGKTVWRIASVCATGNRRGTTGNVAFFELPSGQVLLVYPRDDGGPADYYVIDVKAGRIAGSLKPAANVALRGLGGSFTGVNQSKQDGVSNLIGFNPSLDQVLWRNRGFRLAMRDDDPHYKPTFSPSASTDGILLLSARSLQQPEPPTRQLHAIDLRTGQTLWRHDRQPVAERGGGGEGWRSDDGTPMVAGGKAIIRVQGLLGAAANGTAPDGDALRALDPRTGAEAWTTRPVAGTSIDNRVAVGGTLVAEVRRGSAHELWGYRLADGALAWRRPVSAQARLLASAGGVFYVSERVPSGHGDDYRLQGLDGESGTLLWTTIVPGHNLDLDGGWGIEPDPRRRGSQGPAWRIGRDGAIYGVTLTGAFKLQ